MADRIKEDTETLFRLPGLIRRLEEKFPPKGGAPEPAPLPEISLLTDRKSDTGGWIGYVVAGLAGAGAVWAAGAAGLL